MSGETGEVTSGWTVDTLRANLQRQLDDMRMMLNERYETQGKAIDAAFVAQQVAMTTALTAAERAVATALLSAEKAVTKAEVAAEKRFEAVNEFRGQLNDMVTTLISRTEAEARMSAIAEKLDAEASRLNQRASENGQRISELDAKLSSRLDVSQGRSSGISASAGAIVGGVGLLGSVIAIIIVLAEVLAR